MGKYDRLGAYLKEKGGDAVPMTFAEIERVVGFELPLSQRHQAWWSNSTSNNVMTQVWLDAGYRTEQVDVAGRKLVFRRVQPRSLQENPRMFAPAMPVAQGRHPLFGALKGTFTIAPGYDLTSPTLDDEDLDIEKTADLIEAGMPK